MPLWIFLANLLISLTVSTSVSIEATPDAGSILKYFVKKEPVKVQHDTENQWTVWRICASNEIIEVEGMKKEDKAKSVSR